MGLDGASGGVRAPTAVLLSASAQVQRAKSAAAVARAVVEAAAEICGARGAIWWHASDRGFSAKFYHGAGLVPGACSIGGGLLKLRSSSPFLKLSRQRPDHVQFLDQVGAEQAVAIPAQDGRRRLGLLTVHDGNFEQTRLDLLVVLVQQAAIALRSLALAEERRKTAEHEAPSLSSLGPALTSALSLDELLSMVCQAAARAMAAQACLLFLGGDEAQLRLRAQTPATLADAGLSAGLLQLAELTRSHHDGEMVWRRGGQIPEGVSKALEAGRFQSALGVALSMRGEAIGALLLLAEEQHAFPAHQRRTMLSFAAQAAVAIENLQLFESIQHRLLEMADLTWVSTRVASTHDATKIAATVAEAASRALDVGRVAILVAGPDGRFHPIPEGQHGVPPDGDELLAAEGHLGAEALRSGSPQAVVDAEQEGRSDDALVQWLHARSLLCVPMTAEQGLRGIFVVGDERPRTFRSHAVALVSNYANQAALALQSAMLYQDVVRHLNQLSKLFDVSRTLASSLELSATLDAVLTSASELLEAPVCSVMLMDPERGDLVIKAARGFGPDDILYEPVKPGQGLAGRAAQSGLALTSSDITRDGRFTFRERAREEGLHTAIAAPLVARGHTLGVLNLYRKETQEFTEDDKRLLTSLANSAAVAIENAHLYQEAQERAQFLSAMMSEINHRIRNTLQAIAGLLRMELVRPHVSAEAAIKRGIARIQSAAVVHELMSARDIRFVDMKQVARRIFQLTCQSITCDHPLTVNVTGARVMLPSQNATSAALVMAELIDNAIRHGLAGTTNGRVAISLAEGGGEVVIQVQDNGVGLPEGFDLEATSGMGLKIVRGLVEDELGGKVEVETRDGLLVRARFPKV